MLAQGFAQPGLDRLFDPARQRAGVERQGGIGAGLFFALHGLFHREVEHEQAIHVGQAQRVRVGQQHPVLLAGALGVAPADLRRRLVVYAPDPAFGHHPVQQARQFVVTDARVMADGAAGHERRATQFGAAVQDLQHRHGVDESAAGRGLVPPAFVFDDRQRRRQQGAHQRDHPGDIDPDQEQRQRGQRAIDDRVGRKLADEEAKHALGDFERDRGGERAPERVAPGDMAIRHRHVQQRVATCRRGNRGKGEGQRGQHAGIALQPAGDVNQL